MAHKKLTLYLFIYLFIIIIIIMFVSNQLTLDVVADVGHLLRTQEPSS